MPIKKGAVAAPGHKTKFTKKELRDSHVEHAIKAASTRLKEHSHPDASSPFALVNGGDVVDFAKFFHRNVSLKRAMDQGFRAVDLRTGKVYGDYADVPRP